jgi:hypothetical protein
MITGPDSLCRENPHQHKCGYRQEQRPARLVKQSNRHTTQQLTADGYRNRRE